MTKYKQYYLIVLVYTLAYIYCLEFAPSLVGASGWKKDLNSLHESCACECTGGLCKLSVKGDHYYIGAAESSEKNRNCMITFWGLSHFALYMLLGYCFPNCFWETFAIGIAFEYYEYIKYDCHDTFDIILNTSGFLVGALLTKIR